MKTIRDIALEILDAGSGCLTGDERSHQNFAEYVLAEYLVQQEPCAVINVNGAGSVSACLTQSDSLPIGSTKVFLAHPIPAGMQLLNTRMNSTQRELMLRADEFTVDEMWIMLLAAKEINHAE